MTKQEWLDYYDENREHFGWFIVDYFPEWVIPLTYARHKEQTGRIITILNDIWFRLPDNRFNIVENPPGWSQFLHLIENLPKD